jgi:hypothetical protein
MPRKEKSGLRALTDVSSRGAVEIAIERSKDQRSYTWERAANQSPGRIPVWEIKTEDDPGASDESTKK